MFTITVEKGDLAQAKADLLCLGVCEGTEEWGGAALAVDHVAEKALSRVSKEDGFSGERGATLLFHSHGFLSARRVLLVGLGKRAELDEEAIRQAAAASLNVARAIKAKRLVSVLHGAGAGKIPARLCAKAMVEGFRLAAYQFDKHQSKKKPLSLVSCTILARRSAVVHQARVGLALGELLASGTIVARDLVNEPPMQMKPQALMEKAREIAKAQKRISIRVFDRAGLERLGAGGVLAVSEGSDAEPFLVHLIYKPKVAKKCFAIVGKAITFDSGGLSIKPWDGMLTMKCDMAGAAAVLGLFSILPHLGVRHEVHGIFAACENMPSGKAIRPGDVARAINGKTMEILHTDAEGRITLADALCYAQKQKPDAIVDLATLTGACVVALGEEIAAVMSNRPRLAAQLLESSRRAGESLWELPLEKRYRPLINSEVADIKNIGGKYGGAITAGLFLQEFVGSKTPWAHLDIAGPAFAERQLNPYTRHGATGFGVRTLAEWVMRS